MKEDASRKFTGLIPQCVQVFSNKITIKYYLRLCFASMKVFEMHDLIVHIFMGEMQPNK